MSASLAHVDISPLLKAAADAKASLFQNGKKKKGNKVPRPKMTGSTATTVAAGSSSSSCIDDVASPLHTNGFSLVSANDGERVSATVTLPPLSAKQELQQGDNKKKKAKKKKLLRVASTASAEELPALPQSRTVFAVIFCRLILPPLIMIPLMQFCVQNGFVAKEDRLLQLVICIEAAAPSAQLIIVSLNQLGLQTIASQVAYLYVFLYLFSILTITIFTSVAMFLIY